jgi:ATP-dependent DNA helicase RecG
MPDAAAPPPVPKAPRAAGAPARGPARSAGTAVSGPQKALRKLGLVRDIDLALHLPLRYEDETRLVPIAALREGETAQVQGTVRDSRIELRPRRQWLLRIADDSSELLLRFIHFHPAQHKALAVGRCVRVRGEVRQGFFGREMVHPAVRAVEADAPLPQALTPVYPASAQLPQAYLRKAIGSALRRAPLDELLPPGWEAAADSSERPELPASSGVSVDAAATDANLGEAALDASDAAAPRPIALPPLRDALALLHHPPAGMPVAALEDHGHPAWQRLKFEELLAQQLAQARAQRERARLRAPELAPRADGLHAALRAALPAQLGGPLTRAQQRVVAEIGADLQRTQPMHRLLQGDVGSGKTAASAIDAGWQCALMAPTEILAEQHFRKLAAWLEPLLAARGLSLAWLSGNRRGAGRKAALAAIADGRAALVVGTHAVIQQDVIFSRLGLAVVDEQHRFGVAQRLALRAKLEPAGSLPEREGRTPASEHPRPVRMAAGDPARATPQPPTRALPKHEPPVQARPGDPPPEPHLLMMSATPIPRTLAMSYYADLDVSTIDELPPGRSPVATRLFADTRRDEVVARIRDEVARGRQVYWVCPLVEESEHLDLQNATDAHAALCVALPGVEVGLLHGRLPAADKAAVMARFAEGRSAVLVATTVIEVGVDVPNASLMVIEHAERFGLAQLHQLRGRVGRGAVASVCVLLYTGPLSPTAKSRLKAMVETTDGFEIARRDLAIRGPGEFMGARQSGDALLRFADLEADELLLRQARELAPRLWREHPRAAEALIERWLAGRQDYLKA